MNGEGRVVAELHVFQHALTQRGHVEAYGPHERTPSGQTLTIAAGVGVTPRTEESLWSGQMPETRRAQQ